MKLNQYFQSLSVVILVLSCTSEEPGSGDFKYRTRLWRKTYYSNMQDTIQNGIEYYRYDSLGRLEKNCYGSEICPDTLSSPVYVLYKYNQYNQKVNRLEYGYCYFNDIRGWHIVDSVFYLYDNNVLIKEEQFFPTSPITEYREINYEYENSFLKKKFNYYNGYLQDWILFEYEDTLCTKETIFKDLAGVKIENSIIHFYQDGKKIRSEYFKPGNTFSYEVIKYSYNKDGNLILEECTVNSEWVWPAPYVYRYEYEKAM